MVGRAVGLQIDRLAVMLDRRPRVALIQLSVAEIVVSVSMIGLKMEGIEEIFFGFRKVALIGERIGEAVQSVGVIGVDLDRLPIARDGPGNVAWRRYVLPRLL